MRQKLLILLLIALVFGTYDQIKNRPIKSAPGISVYEAPEQVLLPKNQTPIIYKDFVLDPLATFTIRAKVLGKEKYYFDYGAKISPIDLALGWQEMSDSNVTDQLNLKQHSRFYFYSWKGSPPLDENKIGNTSTNLHTIPSTPLIAKLLKQIRPGQVVLLKGKLVEATDKKGGTWKSSLSREDRGNGACELMWIEEIQ